MTRKLYIFFLIWIWGLRTAATTPRAAYTHRISPRGNPSARRPPRPFKTALRRRQLTHAPSPGPCQDGTFPRYVSDPPDSPIFPRPPFYRFQLRCGRHLFPFDCRSPRKRHHVSNKAPSMTCNCCGRPVGRGNIWIAFADTTQLAIRRDVTMCAFCGMHAVMHVEERRRPKVFQWIPDYSKCVRTALDFV